MALPQAQRKKLQRREVAGGVRFITFSCQRRLPLLLDPIICRNFLDCLGAARATSGFAVFAWVLMPEHVHLLTRPACDDPLASALWSIKESVAKRFIMRWRRAADERLATIIDADGSARFWQKGGGFDRNVRNESEFTRTVRYIHRNPVERGLVTRPEDWPWTSVRWWMGQRDGEFACDAPPGDPRAWAAWNGYV